MPTADHTPPHIQTRRDRVALAWADTDALVLIGAGKPIPVPGGADRTFRFIPHADYRYLARPANEVCPGAVIAYDPRERAWADFVPVVTPAQRVWERIPDYDASPLSDLPPWLEKRAGRPLALLGVPALHEPANEATPDQTARLADLLKHARRPKDDAELARLRRAVEATAAGFARAREAIRPGVTEREVQIELEAAMFRAGADATGYDTIVAAGPNAATLHWTPGDRVIGENDLVLIDAGAEVDGYCADVSRTYAAQGEPTGHRKAIRDLVLRAQRNAVARCTSGTEWADVHLGAARDVAQGLIDIDLMRGDPDDLVARAAHAVFFPHGVGHLVGLGVRDASGTLPGRAPDSRRAPASLRMDLPLAPGYVPTVEPGCYLIAGLINDPALRKRHENDVNWTLADELLAGDLGGVRIEDDVVVQPEGPPVNLTDGIPK